MRPQDGQRLKRVIHKGKEEKREEGQQQVQTVRITGMYGWWAKRTSTSKACICNSLSSMHSYYARC